VTGARAHAVPQSVYGSIGPAALKTPSLVPPGCRSAGRPPTAAPDRRSRGRPGLS
jgi:hypothetical protein